MRRIKKIFFCFFLLELIPSLSSFFLPMDTIQVRIFAHLKISSVSLNTFTGTYRLIGDGSVIAAYKPEMECKLQVKNDSVEVLQGERSLGVFAYLKFFGSNNPEMKI